MLLRPAKVSDLDALLSMAELAKAGLTTLPADKDLLLERLERVEQSFASKPIGPGHNSYLFILEDLKTRQILGTCGIASKVGGFEPHWTYELKYQTFESKSLNTQKEVPYLQIKTNHNGPSEIGTLFLSPEARGKGPWGRFLSLVRFCFIAAYPNCFESEIIAEMRGQIDDQDRSVFWEALGRHFFDMDFKQADRLSMHNKHIIADLMPTHPIYVPLLPKSAQEVIAKTHPDTAPALKLLEQEGFLFTGEVDIFEAGPVVSCQRDHIRTVRESIKSTFVESFEDPTTPPNKIIAKIEPFSQFSATLGHLVEMEEGVSVSKSTQETLQLEKGSPLLYVSLRPREK